MMIGPVDHGVSISAETGGGGRWARDGAIARDGNKSAIYGL